MLHRQQDGLAGLQLQARLVEADRTQPAQPLGEDQREGHPQREVGAEQVEAEEERLAVALLEGVDQRAAHRLHQGLARRDRPDAHRVLDRHLGEVDLAHDRMRPIPVHDGGVVEPAQHLERHVGGHRVDEHESPVAELGRAHAVDHHHVEAFHPALVGVRLADLELHLGIGVEDLLEEQVAGADQQHREGAGRRDHRVGHVVGVEIVGDVEPELEDRRPAAR